MGEGRGEGAVPEKLSLRRIKAAPHPDLYWYLHLQAPTREEGKARIMKYTSICDSPATKGEGWGGVRNWRGSQSDQKKSPGAGMGARRRSHKAVRIDIDGKAEFGRDFYLGQPLP